MKQYFLIFSLSLSITLTFGQEKKHEIDSAELQEAKRRLAEMQEFYKEEKIDEFTDFFNPALIDTFFNYVIKQDIESLYEMTDDIVKEQQSKEEFQKYFGLYNKYFGQLKKYEQITYGIRNNPRGMGKLATATYDIEFEKYPGNGSAIFHIINRDTIKMYSFNLSLKDYTKVDEFHSISEPILKAINEKDNKAIYKLTSQRFKEYNSISDFESLTKKIFDADISEYKIFRYQMGIKDGNEVLISFFEVNDSSGYLQLSQTKIEDDFYLEGLNYIPKN